MPREIPLPLSTPMVVARKAGCKTQTRRMNFRGEVGDIIWWREGLRAAQPPGSCRTFAAIAYAADQEMVIEQGIYPAWLWKGSSLSARFMPRWACRFRDVVTEIRRERLQDITEEDAIAEGVNPGHDVASNRCRVAYADLWDSLHGKKASWESNPEVVVVTFQPV